MQYSTTHGEQWTCVVADRQQEMRQVAAALQRLRQMNRNEIVRHQSGWNRLNTILRRLSAPRPALSRTA